MKVPISWLKEYVDLALPVDELAERLTVAGLEVANIEYIGISGGNDPNRHVWDREKLVGESLRLQVDKLLTGEEVARYFGRQAEQKRQLVIHAGGDPLILGRVNYDEAGFLKGFHDSSD
jgi:hypothetical protein